MAQNQPHQLYLSPLRYPGGKRKIANFLKLLFIHNGLVGRSYSELYAGGAAVALALLFDEYVTRIHINDIDRSIHTFWWAVLEETEGLCRRIRDCTVDMEQWEAQRAVQASLDPDRLDLAFSTFFLNRTNRSGIIAGGVIGGKTQKGLWGIDARFNRGELVSRIKKIARFRSRITLTCLDGATYLEEVAPTLAGEHFFFLDPPYYEKGGELYQNFFAHKDHAQVASGVRKLRHPWLVSYDNVPQIASLYDGSRMREYCLNYSAHERYFGEELLIVSDDLEFPIVDAPARVSSRVVERARLSAL